MSIFPLLLNRAAEETSGDVGVDVAGVGDADAGRRASRDGGVRLAAEFLLEEGVLCERGVNAIGVDPSRTVIHLPDFY